jgi:hypothetical protein
MRSQHSVALLALGLSLSACAKTSAYTEKRLPDGATLFECQLALKGCLDAAERACRGESYTVLGAHNLVKHYGADTGDSKVVLHSSSAVIRCLRHGEEPADLSVVPAALPPRRERPPVAAPSPKRRAPKAPVAPEKAAAASPAPPRAARPAAVCVPGASQACVGPGGCTGGQVCLPDGSGLATCDCGPAR